MIRWYGSLQSPNYVSRYENLVSKIFCRGPGKEGELTLQNVQDLVDDGGLWTELPPKPDFGVPCRLVVEAELVAVCEMYNAYLLEVRYEETESGSFECNEIVSQIGYGPRAQFLCVWNDQSESWEPRENVEHCIAYGNWLKRVRPEEYEEWLQTHAFDPTELIDSEYAVDRVVQLVDDPSRVLVFWTGYSEPTYEPSANFVGFESAQ